MCVLIHVVFAFVPEYLLGPRLTPVFIACMGWVSMLNGENQNVPVTSVVYYALCHLRPMDKRKYATLGTALLGG